MRLIIRGHPANLSRAYLGAHPLQLGGVAPNYTRYWQWRGYHALRWRPARKAVCAQNLEERKLEISTTTIRLSSSALEAKRQRLQRISRPLEANSSTSLHQQHVSRALEANRGNACSASPELPGSMPRRLHDCSPSPYLLEATHLQRTSRAPALNTATPPCLHACSTPPQLHTSFEATPVAHLRSSRALQANSSTSLHKKDHAACGKHTCDV